MKSVGLTILKIALAIALGWYVISQIETADRVVCPPAEKGEKPEAFAGTLEGEWSSAEWVFTSEDGTRTWTPETLGNCALQPGFFTILSGLRIPWYALTLGLWLVLTLIVGWRWQILLKATGVTTSYWNAMRLCFIGYFFNNVMLGQTGGDLVRAVLVTRGLDSNRANAAMSVLVDRLLGLFSLLAMAAIVLSIGLLDGQGEGSGPRHIGKVSKLVYLLVGTCVVGGGLYLSRRFRRIVRFEALLNKFGEQSFVRKIDNALTLYRSHLGTVFLCLGMSFVLQTCGILSFWAMAQALGASAIEVADTFVIYPVVQTISAVPIAPAGWGVGETFYGKFFDWFGSSFTLGVAVSILFRLTTQIGIGLIGGLVWVLSAESKSGLKLNEVPS